MHSTPSDFEADFLEADGEGERSSKKLHCSIEALPKFFHRLVHAEFVTESGLPSITCDATAEKSPSSRQLQRTSASVSALYCPSAELLEICETWQEHSGAFLAVAERLPQFPALHTAREPQKQLQQKALGGCFSPRTFPAPARFFPKQHSCHSFEIFSSRQSQSDDSQDYCGVCWKQNFVCNCNSPATAVEGASWPISPLFWGAPQICTTFGMAVPDLEPSPTANQPSGSTGGSGAEIL